VRSSDVAPRRFHRAARAAEHDGTARCGGLIAWLKPLRHNARVKLQQNTPGDERRPTTGDDAGGEQGPSLRGALMLRPQAWLRQNVALAT
jgi:hypothetical protein